MNIQAISLLLQALLSVVPAITSSAKVNSVVSTLIGLLPIITKEAEELIPMVQNIIVALQTNGNATPEAIAALDTLNATVDKNYTDAVAAFNAAHPVAPATA